jgi:peptide/nickel transport system permease protein
MATYVMKRLIMAVVVVAVVVSLSFFMIRLMPGSPVSALEAQLQSEHLSALAIQARVSELYAVTPKGPLWHQYLQYWWSMLHGHLGQSLSNPGVSVVHIIGSAIPWTLLVVGVALVISFGVGVALGAVMATFQSAWFAKVVTFASGLFSAVPSYVAAILLLYVLADIFPVFPTSGAYGVSVTPGVNAAFVISVARHATLPVLATVLVSFGSWALAMKGSAVPVLGSEYVRAAEAHGLSSRRIVQSYVGRNALLPQVTSLGLGIGSLLGGSVFVETLFVYPGLGYYIVQAIDGRDYPLMMGCFLLITICVVVANLCVDLLYPTVDPRVARPTASQRALLDSISPDGDLGVRGSMA